MRIVDFRVHTKILGMVGTKPRRVVGHLCDLRGTTQTAVEKAIEKTEKKG